MRGRGLKSPYFKGVKKDLGICTCGNKAIGVVNMEYPTGFKIEIPICKECSEEVEKELKKK
jgi:hypothetical protein